ncbi:DUF3817 domain-containing protein [Tomitella fengzijianii]|uniref:DUF3817 domain-containing protein n=1 Tax=Tomitella fengzijianii TaxID=2597660 RepID=A0A516X3V9_9ACTN|nr:DUF3817 domain-containing protein [Tomitella fengzijianii]QDQ97769.1 DUF3817 domain-containing protein [Tomitella fengzijianii]
MADFFDLSTPAKRFRLVAFWEAVTWLILLIGMVFKWGFGFDAAVKIPGMLHGITGFMLFVLVTLITAGALKWNAKVTLLALISSVPPFGTIVFERWAVRNGLLAELSQAPSQAEAGEQDGDEQKDQAGARA